MGETVGSNPLSSHQNQNGRLLHLLDCRERTNDFVVGKCSDIGWFSLDGMLDAVTVVKWHDLVLYREYIPQTK